MFPSNKPLHILSFMKTICAFVLLLPHFKTYLNCTAVPALVLIFLLSCLRPLGALYCAVRSYSTDKDDEVSVPIGSVVDVLRKSDNGWWLIR